MRYNSNYPALRITQKGPPIHCSDRAQRSRQHPGQMLTHRDTAPETSPQRHWGACLIHSIRLASNIGRNSTERYRAPERSLKPLQRLERPLAPRVSRRHRRRLPAPMSLHSPKRSADCPVKIEPQASIRPNHPHQSIYSLQTFTSVSAASGS